MSRNWQTGMRVLAAVVLTALVAPAVAVATSLPAGASGVTLGVTTWDRNTDTGLVSYDLTFTGSGMDVTGGPCSGSSCTWVVEAWHRNGPAEFLVQALDTGSLGRTDTYSKRIALDNVLLDEITHLRAFIRPDYCTTCATYDTGYVEVSVPYPTGQIGLAADVWDQDVDTGRVTYDLLMQVTGAGQYQGPCDSFCSWKVEAWHRAGGVERLVHTLGTGGGNNTWTATQRVTSTNAALTEVTHLRAFVRPDYCTACETYDTGFRSVSSPYPPGQIALEVNSWDRPPDGGAGSYDLTLFLTGAAQVNGPCESFCHWYAEAWRRTGTADQLVATLATGGGAGTWSTVSRLTGSTTALASVTHLRAYVRADYCTGCEIYDTGFKPVGSLTLADWDIDPYVLLLATVSRDRLCDPLLFVPVNNDTDSLPDAYEACETSVGRGDALRLILRVVFLVAGTYGLEMLAHDHAGKEFSPYDCPKHPPPLPVPPGVGPGLDPGPAPAPLPEPVAAGAGFIKLPPNCMTPAEQAYWLDMPLQSHHLASDKHGFYTDEFRKIAAKYELDLNSDWNIIRIPHSGSHAPEYHQWVLDQMNTAHRHAAGDRALFLRLWAEQVYNVIRDNPLAPRVDYWRCYRP